MYIDIFVCIHMHSYIYMYNIYTHNCVCVRGRDGVCVIYLLFSN